MSFKNPFFFILIIPLIIITVFVFKNLYRKEYKINFPLEIIPRYSFKIFLKESVSPFLKFVILLLIIISLARPQKILKTEIPPTEGVDIIMTIDTSLSMGAIDITPNRLESAKKSAKEFIAKRTNDRIGLVVFGGVSYISCPLTLDHSALTAYINKLQLGMTKSDGTAIGDAILTATNHLKNSKSKSKIIILLTDGRSNTGIVQDPITAAKVSKEFGIKIYTIGTAQKGPSQIPTGDPFQPYVTIEDDLNEPELMEIAKITGGKFFRATSSKELDEIYSEIDRLEKTKFETKQNIEVVEMYNYFLIPAIILLFLTIILEKTIILTVP